MLRPSTKYLGKGEAYKAKKKKELIIELKPLNKIGRH